MKELKIVGYFVIAFFFAVGVYSFILFLIPDDYGYEKIKGRVVRTEVSYGGCCSTDWCRVYFDNGTIVWFNPSIVFVDILPLNKTYIFYLRWDNTSSDVIRWCDRIDNEWGEELWRSCRYGH